MSRFVLRGLSEFTDRINTTLALYGQTTSLFDDECADHLARFMVLKFLERRGDPESRAHAARIALRIFNSCHAMDQSQFDAVVEILSHHFDEYNPYFHRRPRLRLLNHEHSSDYAL